MFLWQLSCYDIAFKGDGEKYESSKFLIKKFNTIFPNYSIDIVITVGELHLYWRDVEFQKFMKFYIVRRYNITIETNALINIEFT